MRPETKDGLADLTFQQIIDVLLAPKNTPLNMTPACFAISSPEEVHAVCGGNPRTSLPQLLDLVCLHSGLLNFSVASPIIHDLVFSCTSPQGVA